MKTIAIPILLLVLAAGCVQEDKAVDQNKRTFATNLTLNETGFVSGNITTYVENGLVTHVTTAYFSDAESAASYYASEYGNVLNKSYPILDSGNENCFAYTTDPKDVEGACKKSNVVICIEIANSTSLQSDIIKTIDKVYSSI